MVSEFLNQNFLNIAEAPFFTEIFTIIIVFSIAIITTRIINKTLWNTYKNQRKQGHLIRVDEVKIQIIQKIIKYSIYLLAFFLILIRFDIGNSHILAGAGFAGIVIGFAAQSALSNVISGILLTFDRPFKLGDRLEIAKIYGDLIDIGLRSVRIKTPENLIVTIANNDVASSKIINYTESKYYKTRLLIPIGIAYEANFEKAKKILLKIAEKNPDILEKPAPEVIMKELGEYSINLELWVWTNKARGKRKVISNVLIEVKKEFDKHGIEIPYPKTVRISKND